MQNVKPDDTARKLAALLEKGMRLAGADPALVAEELGGPSLLEVVERDAARARDRPIVAPVSPALSRAVEARRNAAAEPAEEPARRPAPRPAPVDSPARTRLLARTYAAAPLFRPQQWERTDYGFARWLSKGADGRAARVVAALPRILSLRLRRACLALERRELADGSHEWHPKRRGEWRAKVARVLAAIALTLYRKAGATKRRGMNRCTKGISLGMLGTLVHNPDTGAPYSERRMIELCDELETAGVFYREQPPAAEADPETIGPSGWPINLYYFTDRACGRASHAELAGEPAAPSGDWQPAEGSQARQTIAGTGADPPAAPS